MKKLFLLSLITLLTACSQDEATISHDGVNENFVLEQDQDEDRNQLIITELSQVDYLIRMNDEVRALVTDEDGNRLVATLSDDKSIYGPNGRVCHGETWSVWNIKGDCWVSIYSNGSWQRTDIDCAMVPFHCAILMDSYPQSFEDNLGPYLF